MFLILQQTQSEIAVKDVPTDWRDWLLRATQRTYDLRKGALSGNKAKHFLLC